MAFFGFTAQHSIAFPMHPHLHFCMSGLSVILNAQRKPLIYGLCHYSLQTPGHSGHPVVPAGWLKPHSGCPIHPLTASHTPEPWRTRFPSDGHGGWAGGAPANILPRMSWVLAPWEQPSAWFHQAHTLSSQLLLGLFRVTRVKLKG